jgi:hypothetical protein
VNFKSFNDYVKQYSNDIKTFSNRVAIATNENVDFPYFNVIRSEYDVSNNYDIPIIISESFNPESIAINESHNFLYNKHITPKLESIYEDFAGHSFIPKEVSDIKNIKKLKFPILASSKDKSDEYKTIGKLKASESIYNKFRENPIPKTKFTILSFKNSPISIIETINKYPLDVDISKFKHLKEISDIVNKVYEKYNNLDFYNIDIIESTDGGFYINGINRKMNLNPHQAKSVYKCAYEDHYQSRLPKWAEEEIFNESVIPYYRKKALDSHLITSNNSIDYSKIIDRYDAKA